MQAVALAEWFRRRALFSAHHPALTFGEQTWSFAQLQQEIVCFSDRLAEQGVVSGERVGYLGFNHSQFLVALFATARLGAIFVPLNFRLTGSEIAYMINDCGVSTLIAAESHLALIDEVRPSLVCRCYLRLGESSAGWQGIDPLLRQLSPSVEVPDVDPDTVACIIYTSGTTGHPKGAMLSHRNFWTNNLNWMLGVNYSASDVALTSAPLFHSGGLCVITLPTLMAGGHIVLQESFDAGEFLAAIERHRISSVFCVPAMMLFASQHESFAAADLSSVKRIVVGGAPVPEPLLQLYASRGIPVSQCWGMTETSTAATFLSTEWALSKRGSCGIPGLLNEVRLIDFDGKPLTKPHVPGELCVRGDTVMRGYWNQAERTAESFDADGWFRTGDVAYQDEDGYYYICDRLKDMIISGGENIYPAEVESVLYEHPLIAEVAVVGVRDERWGERVVAVVALKAGASMTLEELQTFAGQRLARYKLPRELRLVSALPRNSTGKIQKAMLR